MMMASLFETTGEHRAGDEEHREDVESRSSEITEFRGINIEDMEPWQRHWANTIGTPTFGVEESQWLKVQSIRDSLAAEIEERKRQMAAQTQPQPQIQAIESEQQERIGSVVESGLTRLAFTKRHYELLYGSQRQQNLATEPEQQSDAPLASQQHSRPYNLQHYSGQAYNTAGSSSKISPSTAQYAEPISPISPTVSKQSSYFAANEQNNNNYYYSAAGRSRMKNYYKSLDSDPATESNVSVYQAPTPYNEAAAVGRLAVSPVQPPPRVRSPLMQIVELPVQENYAKQHRPDAPPSQEVIHLENYDRIDTLDLLHTTVYPEEQVPIIIPTKDAEDEAEDAEAGVAMGVVEEEQHEWKEEPSNPGERDAIQNRLKNVKIATLESIANLESKRIKVRRMAADRLEAEYANLLSKKKSQLENPRKTPAANDTGATKTELGRTEENHKRLAAIRMKTIRMLSVVKGNTEESSEDEASGSVREVDQGSNKDSPQQVVQLEDVCGKDTQVDQVTKKDIDNRDASQAPMRGSFRQAKSKQRGVSSHLSVHSALEKKPAIRGPKGSEKKVDFSLLSGSGATCCLPPGFDQMKMNF